jgi:hypothetical protein
MRDGRDLASPRTALAGSLAACFAANARDPDCARVDAEGALLLARSVAEVTNARDLAAAAVARDPRSTDAALLLAEAERRLGHARAGLEACALGLAVNPQHPGLLAARAALLDQSSR